MNFKLLFFYICLSISLSGAIFGQNGSPSEQKQETIVSVEFDGLKNVTPDVELLTKAGLTFSLDEITKDVNRIYLSGFFNKVSYRLSSVENGLALSFVVQENPLIEEIEFEGNTVFPDSKILSVMKTTSGHVFNIHQLKSDLEAIRSLYLTNGYSVFTIDAANINDTGVLKLVFTEGVIDKVNFIGLSKIKEFVLKREMLSQSGRIFNSGEIRNDRSNILRLGYFTEVSAPYLSSSFEKGAVNVNFRVTESKSNLFDTGIEYDYDDNGDDFWVGFLKLNWNHLFLHSDLVSLKTQLDLTNSSSFLSSYSIRYFQPWFLNAFPISWNTGKWLEFREKQVLTGVSAHKRDGFDSVFSLPILGETLSLSTRYKYEEVSPISTNEDSLFDSYKIQSLSTTLLYKTVEDLYDPKSGTYWRLEFEKGGDLGFIKLAGVNLEKISVNWASFLSIIPGQVLGVHAFVGRINFEGSTLESESYNLGGSNSLRGFKEQRFSGPFRVLFNCEYRIRMSDLMQYVVFWDAGNTFSTISDASFSELYIGKGFGIRYFTPIGPFRLDFGFGEHTIIHFNVGQVF